MSHFGTSHIRLKSQLHLDTVITGVGFIGLWQVIYAYVRTCEMNDTQNINYINGYTGKTSKTHYPEDTLSWCD